MGFYGIEHPNPTTPQFAYPRRGGAKLSGTCIVHTAEMYGALNTAAFCMRRSDYGCYHTIVDDKTIIEIYPYEYETWQDSETNNWAVGISAACRAADWNAMSEAQREGYYRNLAWAGADFVKYMKEAYGIDVPLRRLSGAEARARVPGFCAHGDSGIARSDPGTQFDWAKFFRYIGEELSGTKPTEDDERMLVIATNPADGTGMVWAGDGVVRRHIPNPKALADLQWLGRNGFLKVSNNANIAEIGDLDAIGKDLGGVASDVLFKEIDWYGFDGNVPKEGRTKTSVALQMGWADAQVTHISKRIDAVKAVVDSFEVGRVELTESDLEHIVNALKERLTPGLASELAKRLAE